MTDSERGLFCKYHSKKYIKVCTALNCDSRLYCEDCLVQKSNLVDAHSEDLIDFDEIVGMRANGNFNHIASILTQKQEFIASVHSKIQEADKQQKQTINDYIYSLKERIVYAIEEYMKNAAKRLTENLDALNKPVYDFINAQSAFLSSAIETANNHRINEKLCYSNEETNQETIIENLVQDTHMLISSLKASSRYKELAKFIEEFFPLVEFEELSFKAKTYPPKPNNGIAGEELKFMPVFKANDIEKDIGMKIDHFIDGLEDKLFTRDRFQVQMKLNTHPKNKKDEVASRYDNLQVKRLETLSIQNLDDLVYITSSAVRYEVSTLELRLNSKITDITTFGKLIDKLNGKFVVDKSLFMDLRHNKLTDGICEDLMDFIILSSRSVNSMSLLFAGNEMTKETQSNILSTLKGLYQLESLTLDLRELSFTKEFYVELQGIVKSIKCIKKVCLTLGENANLAMVKHIKKALKVHGVAECKIYL